MEWMLASAAPLRARIRNSADARCIASQTEPTPALPFTIRAAISTQASSGDASPEEACVEIAARMVKGKAGVGSVWDAIHLASAELRMRARSGAALASIHSMTSTNALRYAYLSAPDPQTRFLLLLQAAGWVGQFKTAAR